MPMPEHLAEVATHPERTTLADMLALDVQHPNRQALAHHLGTGHRVAAWDHGPACYDCDVFAS